jgi:hypothetical protein
MRRLKFFLAFLFVSFPLVASAGTYDFHPASVLKLGGTFDPQNLLVAYPSCIQYEREYAVHDLDRKQVTHPEPTRCAASKPE